MTSPGPPPGAISQRQKRMGPAPFASFEDLSDEVRSRLESPDDKNLTSSIVRLPGIREDATPTPTTPALAERVSPVFAYSGISLIGAVNTYSAPPSSNVMSSLSTSQTKTTTIKPSTPRIDISRASSSSHHDSRDSTPDRELFDSHDPNSAKLGLGFREDGALDLRSSTEELDYHGESQEKKKGKARPQSPSLHDESYHIHQRKDSQCSDIVLLSISGRTSRLSSIGSQGSAQSRLSNASHLSVMSGQSGISRSSSPHKMVLETSFCGNKPFEQTETTVVQPGTKVESEVLEKVLLSRKHDPTEAILAEGISVDDTRKLSKQPPEKPARKTDKPIQCVKSDITIKVDKPVSDSNNTPKLPKKIISKSGIEYIYIPLKGPLPVDTDSPATTSNTKPKLREVKSANFQSHTAGTSKQADVKQKSKSATPSPVIRKKEEEPKYIRIKLKPDYMYSDEKPDIPKPDSLELEGVEPKKLPAPPPRSQQADLNEIRTESTIQKAEQGKSLSSTPSASPKLSRHTYITDTNTESITPSPSVSRKSSFASLFKSKEAIISPESPTIPSCKRKNTLTGILREASDNLRERSRSRSKSRDRDKTSLSAAPSSTESIDSKSKHKSVLSIFKSSSRKSSKSEAESSSQETLPSIEGIGKVEFKFNDGEIVVAKKSKKSYELPLDGDSIRIPLHSPTYYEERSVLQDWKTSSQDSQETVIEATTRSVNVVIEPVPQEIESNTNEKNSKPIVSNKKSSRQSSTSSENVVFSTKIGNNNEVFSTKLPKHKQTEKVVIETHVEINGHEIEEKITRKDKSKLTRTKSIQEMPSDVKGKKTPTTSEPKTIAKEKPPHSPENLPTTSEIPGEGTYREKRVSQLSQPGATSNRSSILSSNADDDHNSSESERDSEVDFPRHKKEIDLKLNLDVSEPERKGLVLQQDSYEDELPYVPTTLPLERSAAIPIVPVKQRSTYEMKTCPIDRPRSTTPINPSCLEEYCEEVMGSFNVESVTKTIEKLKISLPRNDSMDKVSKVKSPRKGSNTNWADFAGMGITRSPQTQPGDTPPPLPPKGVQKNWINFEEIPEKRKPPKRIQTIPSRGHIEVPDSVLHENVVYNYVNPEECKCECHEVNSKARTQDAQHVPVQEDELPLLEDDAHDDEKIDAEVAERSKLEVGVSDCRSIVSDSSVDLSTSVEQPEANGVDSTLRTPFTSDLGVSSNRSSIVSQDEPQSPGSPNAFPKIS